MNAPIRVVVTHRNRLFRETLAAALDQQPDLSVMRTVASPGELWPLTGDAPQVFVVDFDLPRKNGLGHAREIAQACPSAGVLLIGMSEVASDVIAACEAGASGYLKHDASLEELLEHVRALASGEALCSPKVAALIFGRLRERARELQRLQTFGAERLSRREIEIITLIEERLSNKQIAARLGIEVQTVKNHVHNVLEKLDLDGRFSAAAYARGRGLLPERGSGTGHDGHGHRSR
jgi:DNA-binding NarL/FixJ family response regulator